MNWYKYMNIVTIMQCVLFTAIMAFGLKVELIDKILVAVFGLSMFCGGASFINIYKIQQEEKVKNNDKK